MSDYIKVPASVEPWSHLSVSVSLYVCVFSHLGDLSSEVLVLLWVLQEVDKLQDLNFGLLTAGHVLELHADVVSHHFGRRLAHAEGPAPPATDASSQRSSSQGEEDEAKQQQGGNNTQQKRAGRTQTEGC